MENYLVILRATTQQSKKK